MNWINRRSWQKVLGFVVQPAALYRIGKRAIMALLLASLAACDTKGCVDINLGPVPLSVPKQYLTPTTPRNSNSGNFILPFDSSIPGVDCPVGCKELFVHVSYESIRPPEQQWRFKEPKFTGRMSGEYRVYLDRFVVASNPSSEILVPLDATRPEDEFYGCDPEGKVPNPLCMVTIVAKGGLVAQFSIPRKVLAKARNTASFVMESLDQFSENHAKGICK